MSSKCITVIVAAYNVEDWISLCLESILAQTYKNLEILVIDDGSTDQTGIIIDQYATVDSRIVPVHQNNAGLVSVREIGISLASSDYITFVDGDDSIKPDMYERLMNNLLKYDADISHCGMDFCWLDGRLVSHYNTGEIRIQDNIKGLMDLLSGEKIEPSLCNKLYKKELLINSCKDKNIINNEDLLRNFYVFKRAKKAVYEDFCGYNYFIRKGSISRDFSKIVSMERNIYTARKYIAEDCHDSRLKPYATRLLIASIVSSINHISRIETKDADNLRKECRHYLIKHLRDIKILYPKQRLAVILIIISPKIESFIHSFYRR